MVGFRDQPWETRLKTMGDIAEYQFERTYTQPYVRFGLLRPPIKVGVLPEPIRYTPDYITEHNLIEVQGVGQDQTLKLKYEKLRALAWWQMLMPVHLWVWNTITEEPTEFRLTDIDNLLSSGSLEVRTFPEGKAYFSLPIAEVAYGET